MNARKRHLVIAVSFAGLILFNGCKKSEPAPPETPAGTMQGHEGHEHAAMSAEPAAEVASAAVEQTICPVMEMKIDKNIFVEYKGKKVYFCCPDCKAKFEAEPEKYIAKLPQFKQ